MSLRLAILASLAVTLTLLAGIGAYVTHASETAEADAFLDRQQRQMARYVGDLPFASAEDVALPSQELEDDYVVVVRDRDGRVVRSSHPEVALPDAAATGFDNFSNGMTDWRIFSLVRPERRVQIAQQAVVRREIAEAAAWSAALPMLGAIPLIWLVVAIILRLAFRPLEATARALGERSPTDMQPVAMAAIPAEVRPFVTAFNTLLAKLDATLIRQRAFVADAAHELRTPLAALTLQLGNVRAASSASEREERFEAVSRGLGRASALVDKLLLLARTEALPPDAGGETIDVDAIATQVVADLLPLALERGIDLGFQRRGVVLVRGAHEDLRKLIEILAENALRHIPVGGTVDVSLMETDGGLIVRVIDDGPGIPAQDLDRVFERFVRAAAPGVEGSGLGLPIARAIADRNGLALTLANRTDRSGLVASIAFGGRPDGNTR